MTVCDHCKKVERYVVLQSYTLGLHFKGEPCEGSHSSFKIDLCSTCYSKITSAYDILDLWKKLCREEAA